MLLGLCETPRSALSQLCFPLRTAALPLLILLSRPFAPGIVSNRWRALDGPLAVENIGLTHHRVVVIHWLIVVEDKLAEPILPIARPPLLGLGNPRRQLSRMIVPHLPNNNVKILMGCAGDVRCAKVGKARPAARLDVSPPRCGRRVGKTSTVARCRHKHTT